MVVVDVQDGQRERLARRFAVARAPTGRQNAGRRQRQQGRAQAPCRGLSW